MHCSSSLYLQTDVDWNELERAWEQESSNDITVNLFYGNPESNTSDVPVA